MPGGGESRQGLARYVAPAAFLLAITVAVLLIRSGLGGSHSSAPPPAPTGTTAPVTTEQTRTTATTATITGTTTPSGATFYVVQKGDTFGAIATKQGTTIAELERLNPGVSSNALQVGEKIRVR